MKYIKLFIALCLPFCFTACSNDDKDSINSGAATVEFESPTMEVKESVTLVHFPVVVSGEHNGTIRVNATMKSNNSNFELDKDVIFTTENLRIPAGAENVSFEVALYVENEEMVDGRTIIFELTSSEGATIGTNSTCVLTIKENSLLEGNYTLNGVNLNGKETTTACTLNASENSMETMYIDFGFGEAAKVEVNDAGNGQYNITIPPYQYIGIYGNYKTFLCWISVEPDGVYWSDKESITGTFKDGVITLDTGMAFMGEDEAGEKVGYLNGWEQNTITLTKKKK